MPQKNIRGTIQPEVGCFFMKIIKIDIRKNYLDAVLAAIDVLTKGGVIVFPTDTIYGLGANACDEYAVEQVFKIKNRSFAKPLPIIARNMKWVKEMAYISPRVEKVLGQLWPGSVTVILEKKEIIPNIVTSKQPNVGIRIPDYEFTDKLMAKFGYPLTATSANISGEEGTGEIEKIIDSFKDQVWKPDLIIDAGRLPKCLPSTILDLSRNKPQILRVGPSKPDFLMQLLGSTFNLKIAPKNEDGDDEI